MEIKVKITYLNYGDNKPYAKIVMIYGWYDLFNKITTLGITDSQVIKVERVLEADPENIHIIV